VIFFDLETQRLAKEVGGWANVEAMRLAVACTYETQAGYQDWWEAQASDLIEELRRAKLIVGYNVSKFDYRVLSLYGSVADLDEKTFDLWGEIYYQTGNMVGLNKVAMLNLGEAKLLESGTRAVMLWRKGEWDELIAYCRRDVDRSHTVRGVAGGAGSREQGVGSRE
jgi:DEAD/DEAH box helicase domain-containing protein